MRVYSPGTNGVSNAIPFKNMQINRFRINKTEMALETPFVPRGFRSKFCLPGELKRPLFTKNFKISVKKWRAPKFLYDQGYKSDFSWQMWISKSKISTRNRHVNYNFKPKLRNLLESLAKIFNFRSKITEIFIVWKSDSLEMGILE